MSEDQIFHAPNQLMVLNKFRKRLEREKYINNYASNYYGSMQHRFTIPGILITGVCSVASFLATSDMLNTDTKAGFSIGIGILTAGATILQSVSSAFGFGARKDAFQKSADSYDDLITKIEFEICNPNEKFIDFCNDLESAILKIKNDCAFLPPLFIMAKYEAELAKSHLKLEGSPSKEEVFEDMIIKQITINNTNANAKSVHNKNIMAVNNTTAAPILDVATTDNVCTGLQAQCNATASTPNLRSRLSQRVDMGLEFSVGGINPRLNIMDLEFDERVEPGLFFDNGSEKNGDGNSEV